MRDKDFHDRIRSEFDFILELNQRKGEEYSGAEDVNQFIKTTAAELNLTWEQVWTVFAREHWAAILSYCAKGDTVSDESLNGRVRDLIVLLLLMAIYEDRQIIEMDCGPRDESDSDLDDSEDPSPKDSDYVQLCNAPYAPDGPQGDIELCDRPKGHAGYHTWYFMHGTGETSAETAFEPLCRDEVHDSSSGETFKCDRPSGHGGKHFGISLWSQSAKSWS